MVATGRSLIDWITELNVLDLESVACAHIIQSGLACVWQALLFLLIRE